MELRREMGAGAGSPPFLSIVTRCHPKRPTLAQRNAASLVAQTDPDYERVLLIDNEGIGVHGANKALALAEPAGRYVLVLDDDDQFTDSDAIAALKMVTLNHPDVVVFRCDHAALGVLPSATVWEREPAHGHIGSCDFITRRDWWDRHIFAFGAPEGGDYQFLKAMWAERPQVVWFDRQLTAVQRISKGRGE